MSQREAEERAKELIKHGRMIEAGWVLMLLSQAPDDAPQSEIDGFRHVFFAGCKYMTDVLLMPMDGGIRAQEMMIDNLQKELAQFGVDFAEDIRRRYGRAGAH